MKLRVSGIFLFQEILIIETTHSIGLTTLAFVVLPQLDPVSASVFGLIVPVGPLIIIPMIMEVFIPFFNWIRNLLGCCNTNNSVNVKATKNENTAEGKRKNRYKKKRLMIIKRYGMVGFIFAYGLYFAYLHLSFDVFSNESRATFSLAFLCGTVFTSSLWWESTPFKKPWNQSLQGRPYFEGARSKETLIISIYKIVLNLCLLLVYIVVIVGHRKQETREVLFGKFPSSNITVFSRTIVLTSEPEVGVGCLFEEPYYLALLSISSGLLFWKLSEHACKIMMHVVDFAIPVVLNVPLTPVTLYLVLSNVDDFVLRDCNLPFIIHWTSVTPSDIALLLAAGILGYVSMIMLTLHVWKTPRQILAPRHM